MLYGISGRDCSVVIINWNTHAYVTTPSFVYTAYMPLLSEITIPLSSFATPIPSVGTDTVATIAATTIEPRTISATFILQADHLANPFIFPFADRSQVGLIPFFKQGLHILMRKPPTYNIASFYIPEAIVSSWVLEIPENRPATVTITWSFNTVNLLDVTNPILNHVNPNAEFITIRNVSIESDSSVFPIPAHGVRSLTFRINANVQWLHRVGLFPPPNKPAYEYTYNRWEVSLELTLSPDAVNWFGRHLETLSEIPPFNFSFVIRPVDATLAASAFRLVPYARLISGRWTAQIAANITPVVSLAAPDFFWEVLY